MAIRNIIFDWDGTLAKTLDLWLEGYQQSFDRRGLRFKPIDIVREFFHNHHEVPERYPDIDFTTIAEETRNHVLQSLSTMDLYDGAPEILTALKQKDKSLSLVTSSARHMLTEGLSTHNLGDFFASTIAGDDGYGHKPAELPFEETLNRMGASASETLIVGDSHVDIQAGQAIGCQTCWFAPPQNRLFHNFEHVKSMGADHEIDEFIDLIELV